MLTAPAGYGKTTLLAQFAGEVDALTCWCTLDDADRDPRTLLTYLVAAIRRHLPGFGRRVLAVLEAGEETNDDQFLRAAVGLLVTALHEVQDYLLLILDDCQVPGLKLLVPWSRQRFGSVHPQLVAWLASVRQQLELATAKKPAPPR